MPSTARLTLPVHLADEIRRLAERAFPDEGCGILVGRPDGGGTVRVERLHASLNLSERPRNHYVLDPAAHARAVREARADGLAVLGFWHSHPSHPAVPSETDRATAFEEYAYVIVAVAERDGAARAEEMRAWRLEGDGFREEQVREM